MLSKIIRQSIYGIENRFVKTRAVATIWISLILIGLSTFLCIFCMLYKVYDVAIVNIIIISVSFIVIHLCRIQKSRKAIYLMLFTILPMVFIAVHFAYRDLRFTDTENFFFLIMVVGVFLLDGKSEKIFTSVTILCFIYFKYLKATLLPDSYNSPPLLLLVNSIAVIIISYIVMILLKRLLESIIIKLNKANEDKNRLINIIAHDVRGPINNFEALLDAFLKGYITHDELVEHSENIKVQIIPIRNTIDDLLYWSLNQLKGLKCKPESINLNFELNNLLNQLKYDLTKKNISVIKKLDTNTAFIDPNHFKIIFRNVLHNCVKYSPENTTIKIEANESEKGIKVKVSDQGRGMSEEQIDNIMNQEVSFKTTGTKGEKGKGIGLTFCIHLLKLNNGEIEISSAINKGTVFNVNLPKS
ncbi:sensor histidine kinase [Marinigracilibium pacificum]|uniref:histidine kinase n=1 Tax=Marinigracilibium pacificum TaxID=2729599 RepID=A0A848J1H7_9BACT|nr:HAMP domain-containing sensor histidine kinase [Marinigracilibium pacificum]NMM48334.1 HAMP domain-containing histidine kinase [Marinigracilibium pacificum]